MLNYSIIIPTYNEQKNIERCFNSIDLSNDVIVVDSYSKDQTFNICKNFDVHVIQNEFISHGKQIMYASKFAKNDWIFVLDADERFSCNLDIELKNLKTLNEFNAFKIRRINYFSNVEIKHGTWKHDFPIRFFNKRLCYYNDRLVHSSLVVKGKVGLLENTLKHYSYNSISDYIQKVERFSRCGARDLVNLGKKQSYLKVIFRSLFRFFKSYILYKGFLDGKYGFIIAILESIYVALKYLILIEINMNKKIK